LQGEGEVAACDLEQGADAVHETVEPASTQTPRGRPGAAEGGG
jgi:hypothetical protein